MLNQVSHPGAPRRNISNQQPNFTSCGIRKRTNPKLVEGKEIIKIRADRFPAGLTKKKKTLLFLKSEINFVGMLLPILQGKKKIIRESYEHLYTSRFNNLYEINKFLETQTTKTDSIKIILVVK